MLIGSNFLMLCGCKKEDGKMKKLLVALAVLALALGWASVAYAYQRKWADYPRAGGARSLQQLHDSL